jgi:dihydropteroate synthase
LFEAIGNRTLVMGITNITPDSFSDGGLFADKDSAVQHAVRMVEEGADVIDVGGQSTRPGSQPIPVEQEIDRVVPVIRELASRLDVPISVDTYVAEVAKAALDSGALMINDISAASFDPDMPDLIAERQCPAILMHIKGTPMDMQLNPRYDDLMGEICAFLRERVRAVVEAGADEKRLMIDPGFGFGKTVEHNLEILRRLGELRSLGRPVVVGTSRKSTIGKVLGDLPVGERLEGTAATVALSIARGADIVRVHDVKQMARVARMTDAVTRLPQPCQPSAPR